MSTAEFDQNAPNTKATVDGQAPAQTRTVIPFHDCVGIQKAAPSVTVMPSRWLEICHGNGELAKSGLYPAGALVLGREFMVAKAKTPLRCLIIGYRHTFREYRFQQGVQPQEFATAAEAIKAGFTVEKVGDVLPTAPECITLRVLIEKPSKDLFCPAFCMRVGDRDYASAFVRLEKSSMRRSGKRVDEMIAYAKLNGIQLPQVEWTLMSDVYKAQSGHEPWVFDMRYSSRILDIKEFEALVKTCVDNAAAAQAATENDEPADDNGGAGGR